MSEIHIVMDPKTCRVERVQVIAFTQNEQTEGLKRVQDLIPEINRFSRAARKRIRQEESR